MDISQNKLDSYEQEIEDQHDSLKTSPNKKELTDALVKAAKQCVQNKNSQS